MVAMRESRRTPVRRAAASVSVAFALSLSFIFSSPALGSRPIAVKQGTAPVQAGTYRVQAGDTIGGIAARAGLSTNAVVEANNLVSPYVIWEGQTLTIPNWSKKTSRANRSFSSEKTLDAGVYVVRPGDTVIGIAGRAGVSVRSFIQANGLGDDGVIRVGQKLVIPGSGGSPSQSNRSVSANTGEYTVQSGDTLWDVARRHQISVSSLKSLNGLLQDVIFPGQALKVSGVRNASAAETSGSQAGRQEQREMPRSSSVSRGDVENSLEAWADHYGLAGDLVKGLAWVESGHRQDVISKAGALGVMQLMPSTAQWLEDYVVRESVDPLQYDENVRGGTAYLDWLLGKTGGDERLAVGSYFQGLGATRKHGLYRVSEHYVRTVQAARRLF